jgi:hypothetical protein
MHKLPSRSSANLIILGNKDSQSNALGSMATLLLRMGIIFGLTSDVVNQLTLNVQQNAAPILVLVE